GGDDADRDAGILRGERAHQDVFRAAGPARSGDARLLRGAELLLLLYLLGVQPGAGLLLDPELGPQPREAPQCCVYVFCVHDGRLGGSAAAVPVLVLGDERGWFADLRFDHAGAARPGYRGWAAEFADDHLQ